MFSLKGKMGDAEVGVINYNNNVDGLKDPKPSM